jgi:predicted GH43/DUF377 family glycosyl hydrolase
MDESFHVSSPTGSWFTTPEGLSPCFKIFVNTLNNGLVFQVSNLDLTPAKDGIEYFVENRDHQSYLNLFEKLSHDFNTRLPKIKQENSYKSTFKVSYREVLTENINLDILYGYGDPAVIKINQQTENTYYLIVTSNDAPNSFPILKSADLIDWQPAGFIFPQGKKPNWAADGLNTSDFWAPEMHFINEHFQVFFVARHKESKELCIGRAISKSPEGPFIADEQPILQGNVIDPHLFVEEDGTPFLFWKEDNNDVWPGLIIDLLHENPYLVNTLFAQDRDRTTVCFITALWPWIRMQQPMERFQMLQIIIEAIIADYNHFCDRLIEIQSQETGENIEKIAEILKFMKTPMFAQRLSTDGSTLLNERTKIIENDLDWEAHLVEGMWVTKHDGTYYLFYAGNDFSTDKYGIGVATANQLLGPYKKSAKPFLQSGEEWWAPGHPSVVNDLSGMPTMFLHAYYPENAGYKKFRALLALPLLFENGVVKIDPDR